MPHRPVELEYVSWGDVHDLVRYLEAGYGGRIKFTMTVACPKGEQRLKQYWELKWCDHALEERNLSQRVLGAYPANGAKSLATAFVGLLYQLDSILSKEGIWAPPTTVIEPRVWGATKG